jgi:hypothetical protein
VLRSRLAAVPVPLRLMVVVSVVVTVAWAVAEPPLQAPDEARHFGYVQHIVEQRELPWRTGGALSDPASAFSTEVEVAQRYAGLDGLAGNPAAKDNRTAADERLWRRAQRGASGEDRADGGITSAMRNPPLYYLYAAVPYAAATRSSFFTRSFAIRLANLPFLVAAVVAVWLLAGLLLGPRRWAQTLATGVVALNAQLVGIAAAIGPDLLLTAAYAWGLYAMALILLRGATRGRVLALAGLCAVASLAQVRGAALIGPALLTCAIAAWRARGPYGPRARRQAVAAAAAVVAATVATAAYVATRGTVSGPAARELGSYLWQFYLPRLGFMTPTVRADWSARDVFVDRFWGTFGQFDTFLAPWLADLLAGAALVGLAALCAALARRRAVVRRARAIVAVLAVAVVAYLGLLHVVAWRTLQVDPSDPVLTGRYLLPFLPLLGVAVAFLVAQLPARVRAPAAGLVLSAALALQLASLGAILLRMHA